MADPKTLSGADLQKVAADAAKTYNIPQDMFFRLIGQESSWQAFNPDGTPKTSSAGAIGIAQFMKDTAADPGFGMKGFDPTDPVASLYNAAEYLSHLHDSYTSGKAPGMAKGERGYNDQEAWYLADAAYNSGQQNVAKAIGSSSFWAGASPFADRLKSAITTVTGNSGTADHLNIVVDGKAQPASRVAADANKALGVDASSGYSGAHKGAYQTSGDQPPDLRDYMVTNSDGSQSPDTVAWGQAVTAYKTYQEGKALARDYQLGPYTQWVDDVTKQITADIAAGNLSLTKANDLFTAKLSAYKTATDAWNSDSFRRGAPEGAQYVPGSEPGGFENTVLGLPPTPVSPNAPVINPLQEALRLSNQADQTIGNVQVPSVPDYGAVRQQVGGGGPGSSRNADLTAVGSQFNAQTLLQQALNKTHDMAMFDQQGNGGGTPA